MHEFSLRSSQIIADNFLKNYESYDRARALDEEEFYREIGKKYGFESLTIGSKGYASSEWFRQHKKAFFSGFADVAVVAAVCNDAGMGASHHNTLTAEEVKNFIVEGLQKDGGVNGSLQAFTDKYALYRAVSTPTSRLIHSASTLDEALGQFKLLTGGKVPQSTRILMVGASHLEPPESCALTDAVKNYIEATFGKVNGLEMDLRFGQPGGIIYGGESHTKYSQPAIITYEMLTVASSV